MINENLHKKPVALDRVKHRALKLDRSARDMSRYKTLNSFFIAIGEFVPACRDLAVVWVEAGQGPDGKTMAAPIVLFGLAPGQNLCIDANDNWRVRYVPAMLRMYPFAVARTSDTDLLLCVDEEWMGLSTETGEALFNPDGTPTQLTLDIQKQLETMEVDVERTRMFCGRLMELKLLRPMQFDATMPSGEKIHVDGFLAVDEERLANLSDAEVTELGRSGLLGLIHAHQISLGNMARLAEWQAELTAANTAATPATPAA